MHGLILFTLKVQEAELKATADWETFCIQRRLANLSPKGDR